MVKSTFSVAGQRKQQAAVERQREIDEGVLGFRQRAKILTVCALILFGLFASINEGFGLLVRGDSLRIVHEKTNQLHVPLPDMKPFDMTQYDTIHLFHLRKAGGTSLRLFLKQIADLHNISFTVNEGECWRYPDKFVDQHHLRQYTDPNHNHSTLVVTMLRDPVDRVVSAYWGEGDINASNPHSFRDWIAKMNATAVTRNAPDGFWMWGCASNCLTKWYGGGNEQNLTKARNQLANDFDLIIQSNRLGEARYQQWLAHILGAPSVPMPHERKAPSAKYDLNGTSAYPTDEDLQQLLESNQVDKELLEWIVEKRPELIGPL